MVFIEGGWEVVSAEVRLRRTQPDSSLALARRALSAQLGGVPVDVILGERGEPQPE